jgi:hypothetical protein
MVELFASYPPWRHHLGASLLRSISSTSLGSFGGPLDLGLLDQTMAACGIILPHGGIIFKLVLVAGDLRQSELHLPRR